MALNATGSKTGPSPSQPKEDTNVGFHIDQKPEKEAS